MKVTLIYPRSQATNDAVYRSSRLIDRFLQVSAKIVGDTIYAPGKRAFHVPPLNLLLLASFLTDDIDVEIVDERTRPIDFNSPTDLVGLSALTADAPHVYEIADEYHRRGVKVVLGGIHPTIRPTEAAQHADAVVSGECDDLFLDIVRDAQRNRLRPFYRRAALHDLTGMPPLRKDLLDERYYVTPNVIQATRGCPHRCSFCSISVVSGPSYRCRPVREVVNEIEHSGPGFFGFVDDNVGGNIPYAKDLFTAMSGLGIQWFGNITTAALHDSRLLKVLAQSGCKIVLIGFESLSQSTLKSVAKAFNRADQYVSLVRRIHDHGIGVIGSFMLGLDDAIDDVDAIVNFARTAPLDIAQVSILTPYPGTALFDQMISAGRIRTTDWQYYDTTAAHVVFEPKHCTPEELEDKYLRAADELYSVYGIASRLLRSRRYPMFFLPYNLRFRKKRTAARRLISRRRQVGPADRNPRMGESDTQAVALRVFK